MVARQAQRGAVLAIMCRNERAELTALLLVDRHVRVNLNNSTDDAHDGTDQRCKGTDTANEGTDHRGEGTDDGIGGIGDPNTGVAIAVQGRALQRAR